MLMGLADGDLHWLVDRRGRVEYFKEILHDGVNGKLLNMIICIYEQRRKLLRSGKKLSVTDSTTLKAAEKLVEEEFSWALKIDIEEVPRFIRKRLHIPEEQI